MKVEIHIGDALARLREMPDNSVHCVVTSPPYFGLRDYGVDGQIGLEETPAAFLLKLVEVFREVSRVLRPDGTCWVNMGDSYAGSWGSHGRQGQSDMTSRSAVAARQIAASAKKANRTGATAHLDGLKAKDLMMIPARLAIALCDDGWYLRQEIIWSKPNPMPESVFDRCTKSHEYIYLLAKSSRYFYDNDAVREPHAQSSIDRLSQNVAAQEGSDQANGGSRSERPMKAVMKGGISAPGYDDKKWETRSEGLTRPPMTMKDRIYHEGGRNMRSVWNIATLPFKEAHFATFPPRLVEPCIKAGTSEAGCCPACGAPWHRITDKEFTPQEDVKDPEKLKRNAARMDSSSSWGGSERGTVSIATLGWAAACACGGDPIPCTVLDPFFGAGTTALVAHRLQRNCIGIELNPEYAEMAKKRLIADAGMLINVEVL